MAGTLGKLTIREVPVISASDTLGEALRTLVESALPQLPVVDAQGRAIGTFGEREAIIAIFPGYVTELGSARFVTQRASEYLKKRYECFAEPVSDHLSGDPVICHVGFSDTELAEKFEHHRVSAIPIVDDAERPVGIVPRGSFLREVRELLLSSEAGVDMRRRWAG